MGWLRRYRSRPRHRRDHDTGTSWGVTWERTAIVPRFAEAPAATETAHLGLHDWDTSRRPRLRAYPSEDFSG